MKRFFFFHRLNGSFLFSKRRHIITSHYLPVLNVSLYNKCVTYKGGVRTQADSLAPSESPEETGEK